MAKTPDAQARPFRRVPFNPIWITHDKIDLKAIYRRPVYTEDARGERVRQCDADGLPLWDLTTPLQVRHHNKHQAKGFEYVTLATMSDLAEATKHGTILEGEGRDYINHRIGGPWDARLYLADAVAEDRAAFMRLKELVERLGSATVLAVRQSEDPAFELPPSLQNIPAPGATDPLVSGNTISGNTGAGIAGVDESARAKGAARRAAKKAGPQP